MKQLFQLLILSVTCIGFTSCSKDEIKTYDGKPSVFFYWSVEPEFTWEKPKDSCELTFAYFTANTTDTVYNLPIGIAGPPTDHDRTIKLAVEVGTNAIAGVHYNFPGGDSVILKAGTNVVEAPIQFLRTDDMTSDTIVLDILLKESKDFVSNMAPVLENAVTGQSLFRTKWRVYISDIVVKPKYWLEFITGKFSVKKFKVMSQVLGLSYYELSSLSDISLQLSNATIVQRYLNNQKKAGTPILEDDGTEMIMGSSAQ